MEDRHWIHRQQDMASPRYKNGQQGVANPGFEMQRNEAYPGYDVGQGLPYYTDGVRQGVAYPWYYLRRTRTEQIQTGQKLKEGVVDATTLQPIVTATLGMTPLGGIRNGDGPGAGHPVVAAEKTMFKWTPCDDDGNKMICAYEPTVQQDSAEPEPEKQTAEDRERQRREQPPLLYCKLVAKYPLWSFLLTLSGHLLMVVVSVALVLGDYDLFPVDFSNIPLQIRNQPWLLRDWAWRSKDLYPGYYDRTPMAGYRTNTARNSMIFLFYNTHGGNVFTKENLQKIKAIEDRLYNLKDYSEFCQLDSNHNCTKPLSVISFFDGTYSAIHPIFNDPKFENIPAVIYTALNINVTKSGLQFFLSKSHKITQTHAYSDMTRSILFSGFPWESLDTLEYETKVRNLMAGSMTENLESIRTETSEFEFSYNSFLLFQNAAIDQAMKDAMCAVGSVCFIFLFIVYHTQSLWISGFAVLSILTSFACANLIYRIVLDFRYIGFFHILTLFIVLGIGADDIFVFYDIWRNTAFNRYPSLAHRLSDAYRSSVVSMLFTSITTSVAFFATAVYPMLATRSFGVFSGIVILVNYISVIVYFPTVIAMYHTKFEKFHWPCFRCFRTVPCCCCASDTHTDTDFDSQTGGDGENGHSEQLKMEPVFTNAVLSNVSNGKIPPVSKPIMKENNSADISQETDKFPAKGRTGNRKKKSVSVRFFGEHYFSMVTHRVYRWLILAVIAGVLGFFIYQASQLEPDDEPLALLKKDHVLSVAEDLALNAFTDSDQDNTITVYLAWGLKEQDMTHCHFSTPLCSGNPVYDEDFNPNSPAAQMAVLKLCNKMLSFTAEEAEEFKIRRDFTTKKFQVGCFLKNLGEFLDEESLATGTDWRLPFDYNKTISFMDARPQFFDSSNFTTDNQHFLEVPISYWLSNRYTYKHTGDFYEFDGLVGEKVGRYSSHLRTNPSKLYGNSLQYVAIRVNTTIKATTLGYELILPVMNKWEDFIQEEMKHMPEGMQNGFQLTFRIWHWAVVQENLVKNAIYGIAIGISLALPILIIATHNIVIGFLATFSMSCSTICVIGILPLSGWKLGVIASVNMCMVVGLTVDYVVHLAVAYTHSKHKDRRSRLRDMLDEMGVSIFFGACTTLGASLFMFIAQLAFFFQFGIFMFTTVGFSLLFSMGMFVTLMGLFGPENDTGNVVVAARRLKLWCSRRCTRAEK